MLRWIFVCLLLGGGVVFAQAPDTLWTRTYDFLNNDAANGIIGCDNGDILVVGRTYVGWPYDYQGLVARVTSSGDTLWSRQFGGNNYEDILDATQLNAGGFAVLGNTQSFGNGNLDFYLCKLTETGDTIWTRTFGGSSSEYAFAIKEAANGDFILAGRTASYGLGSDDAYIIRTNSQGIPVWSRTYGTSYTDEFEDVEVLGDGRIVAAGYSAYLNNPDLYIALISATGDSVWTRRFGWAQQEYGRAVSVMGDKVYLTGYTSSFDASGDMIVCKLNLTGDTLWTRRIGGGNYEDSYDVMVTPDGVVVAGHSKSFGDGFDDLLMQKFSHSGDSIWRTMLLDPYWEVMAGALVTLDFGYYCVATSGLSTGTEDIMIIRYETDVTTKGINTLEPIEIDALSILSFDTIRWTGVGFEGGVSIELNRHYPIGPWETIADSTENDGAYEWFVTDPLSDSCRIRIRALADTFCDVSDGNFSIVSSQGYLALVKSNQANTPLTSWDFGDVECPQTGGQWFRPKNFGSESIVVFQPQEPVSSEFGRTTTCGTFFALAPNQMSACSVLVSFDPASDGDYSDVLRVQTDAVNGVNGLVEFPLSGAQVSTPAAPEIVIQSVGEDAQLSWAAVDTSIGGCPAAVARYLVFYSQFSDGPFFYHGYTTGTTYTHLGVVTYAPSMFYQVMAVTAPETVLDALRPETEMTEVMRKVGLGIGMEEIDD